MNLVRSCAQKPVTAPQKTMPRSTAYMCGWVGIGQPPDDERDPSDALGRLMEEARSRSVRERAYAAIWAAKA